MHSKHKHKSHPRADDNSGSRKRKHENQEYNGSAKSSSKHSKKESHNHRSRYISIGFCSSFSNNVYLCVIIFFLKIPLGTTINLLMMKLVIRNIDMEAKINKVVSIRIIINRIRVAKKRQTRPTIRKSELVKQTIQRV